MEMCPKNDYNLGCGGVGGQSCPVLNPQFHAPVAIAKVQVFSKFHAVHFYIPYFD